MCLNWISLIWFLNCLLACSLSSSDIIMSSVCIFCILHFVNINDVMIWSNPSKLGNFASQYSVNCHVVSCGNLLCFLSPIFVSLVAPLAMAAMCFVGEEALFQFSIKTNPFAATRHELRWTSCVFRCYQFLPLYIMISSNLLYMLTWAFIFSTISLPNRFCFLIF
jgi:hypothetical protein